MIFTNVSSWCGTVLPLECVSRNLLFCNISNILTIFEFYCFVFRGVLQLCAFPHFGVCVVMIKLVHQSSQVMLTIGNTRAPVTVQ